MSKAFSSGTKGGLLDVLKPKVSLLLLKGLMMLVTFHLRLIMKVLTLLTRSFWNRERGGFGIALRE